MVAIDTNVLVRLLTRDDLSQVRAAEVVIRQGAWGSLLVLAETSWVLASVHDVGRHELARSIEMLLDHRQLVLEEPVVVRAALERFRGRPSLGFSDCLVLERARAEGRLPLGTFDRALGKSDGAIALEGQR
jgi:predicted nucleic-acid-binding protein